MQNKKAISIFIFLSIFWGTICLDVFGQTDTLNTADDSVFFKKNKPPVLSPEKKTNSADILPQMELIKEQSQSAQDETLVTKMPLIEVAENQREPEDLNQLKIANKNLEAENDDTDNDNDEDDDDDDNDNEIKEEEPGICFDKKATDYDQDIMQNKQIKIEPKNENNAKKLSFGVENTTGQTIYVACFAYIKKRASGKWRWQKSPVQKIDDNHKIEICTDEIEDDEDRENVFGYLGVFENLEKAEDATFETLSDKKKIDLDLIAQLKDKTVKIEIEKYGILGSFYDYDFVKKSDSKIQIPELDFEIENKTGKSIWATCFVYQKKAKSSWLAKKTTESWSEIGETRDDMSVWRFDKTSVIKINPDELGKIDIDTIIEPRDRIYIRGYLVLFDEDEQQLAENATYELLPENTKKLDLGRLIDLKNKKITIYAEKYGTTNLIDYTTQPTKRIDMIKITSKIG